MRLALSKIDKLEKRLDSIDPLAGELPAVAYEFSDCLNVGGKFMTCEAYREYMRPFESRGLPGLMIRCPIECPRDQCTVCTK